MPKILSNILTYTLLGLIFVGIVVGSVYLYTYNLAKKQNFDTVVQRFDAKKIQQAPDTVATEKLKVLQDIYTAQSELNAVAVNTYTSVNMSLAQTDSLFNNPKSSHPVLNVPASPNTISSIDTLRQKINALLIQWQTTIASIKDSSSPNTTLIDQANSEIAILQTYLSQLEVLVNGLTPGPGDSQQQINTYQADISAAQAVIDAAATELANAENAAGVTNNGGQSTIQPVTPVEISQQQQIVNQTYSGSTGSDQSSVGGNSDGDISSGGTSGITSPFVSSPINSTGTPQLIEGANTY